MHTSWNFEASLLVGAHVRMISKGDSLTARSIIHELSCQLLLLGRMLLHHLLLELLLLEQVSGVLALPLLTSLSLHLLLALRRGLCRCILHFRFFLLDRQPVE